MRALEEFFRDLDTQWHTRGNAKTDLRLIGSAALMLQTGYTRGTKDSDVLVTPSLTEEVKASLLAIAGKDSRLFDRHRLYLEVVPAGLPFLPQKPLWHPLIALTANLSCLRIEVLDIADVVVSKFKRAHAVDMDDIAAMVDAGMRLSRAPRRTLSIRRRRVLL